MLNNLPEDNEKILGNGKVVLLEDAENTRDWPCKQEGSFKGNRIKMTLINRIRERHLKFLAYIMRKAGWKI